MRHCLPIVVIAASVAAAPVRAQPSPSAGRIPTVTRLVKQFSELEMSLVAKARAKSASALDDMLDPSFEMRPGSAPGVPVPRDAWIREARATAREPPRIEQMAVHDLGDVALVSFRETDASARLPGRAHSRFVIDCWKREGDGWKLAVRYQSGDARRGAPKALEKRY
jgi:ketosteroid isomerase-like protein